MEQTNAESTAMGELGDLNTNKPPPHSGQTQADLNQLIGLWTDDDRKDRVREALIMKRGELLAQRDQVDKEIVAVDRSILMVTRDPQLTLSPETVPDPPKRVRVGELAAQTVKRLSETDAVDQKETEPRWIGEDDLIEAILREEPLGRRKSVKGAIRSLVTKGLAVRQGDRGAYSYQWRGPVSDEPSAEDKFSTAMAMAGSEGISEAELVWKVGDAESAKTILAHKLGIGRVESFPVGEGKVHFRIPRSEDTPQGETKALFPGADRPEASP